MFTMVLKYIEYRFRFRLPFWIQTYLAHVFNNKKCVQNHALSMLKAALFPESLPLTSDFFTFVLHFMLYPERNALRFRFRKGKKLRLQRVTVAQHWSQDQINQNCNTACLVSFSPPPPHPPPPGTASSQNLSLYKQDNSCMQPNSHIQSTV